MPTEIPKNTGYVVGQTDGSITDAKGYVVASAAAESSVFREGVYVAAVPSSALSRTQSYASLVNPASIIDATAYVVATASGRLTSIMEQKGHAVLYSFYPPYEDLTTVLPFIDTQFPTCVSYGSSGGPGFKTTVFEVDSGLTATEIEWERIRSQYEVSFDHVDPADIEAVETFFYGMKGRGIGFRYKDWSDFTIANQNFFVGDGTTRTFQLFKRYTSGGYTFDRLIKKPVGGTMELTLNGAQQIDNQDYFVNTSTGEITFQTPPENNALGTVIQAEFDVPVRFDADFLNVSYDDHQQLNISGLPLLEVLT